jgi:hypothetical protein
VNRRWALVAVPVALALAACGGDDDISNDPDFDPGSPAISRQPEERPIEWNEFTIPLAEGDLRCVWIRTNRGEVSIGGPSCDWDSLGSNLE